MSQQQANQQEADDFGNRPSQELTAMSVRATEGGRNDELGPDSIQVQPNERMPGKGIVVAEEESRANSSPSRSEPISKTVDEAVLLRKHLEYYRGLFGFERPFEKPGYKFTRQAPAPASPDTLIRCYCYPILRYYRVPACHCLYVIRDF